MAICHRAAGVRAGYPRPAPHLPSRYSSTGDRGWREYVSKGRYSDQGSTAAAVYEYKGVKGGKGAKEGKGMKGGITALALLFRDLHFMAITQRGHYLYSS
jgi:hypothetical protein